MSNPINNSVDVIDSRDVIARIEELEALVLPVHNTETGLDELDPSIDATTREELKAELDALLALLSYGEPNHD